MHDGPLSGADSAQRVAVSLDGSKVFVGGLVATMFPDTSEETQAFTVLAYDANGNLLWSYVNTDGSDVHDLLVTPDGTTVIAAGLLWPNGVVALDADDGTVLWHAQNGGSNPAYDLALSPNGTRVFVAAHSAGLFSFDAAAGSLLWRKDTAGLLHPQQVAVAPDGSRVFAGGNGPVVAFDAADGDVLWSGPRTIMTDPAVTPDGSKVLAVFRDAGPAGYPLYRIQARAASNGTVLWTSVGEFNSFALSDDGATVVALSSTLPRRIGALDAATGDELWSVSTHTGARGARIDPLDDVVVVMEGASSLDRIAVATGYSLADGSHAWTATIPASSSSADTPVDTAWSADSAQFFVVGNRYAMLADQDIAVLAFDV